MQRNFFNTPAAIPCRAPELPSPDPKGPWAGAQLRLGRTRIPLRAQHTKDPQSGSVWRLLAKPSQIKPNNVFRKSQVLSQVPRRKYLCERTPPQLRGQGKALVFVRSPLGQPSQLTQQNTQCMLRAKTTPARAKTAPSTANTFLQTKTPWTHPTCGCEPGHPGPGSKLEAAEQTGLAGPTQLVRGLQTQKHPQRPFPAERRQHLPVPGSEILPGNTSWSCAPAGNPQGSCPAPAPGGRGKVSGQERSPVGYPGACPATGKCRTGPSSLRVRGWATLHP